MIVALEMKPSEDLMDFWTSLKELMKEVDDLKMFKTKAITVFAVVQFAMAIIVFAQRFM